MTRPAVANERLSFNKQGNILYKLKTPYHDGTTYLIFTPLVLLQRVSALIPRPEYYNPFNITPSLRNSGAQVVPTKPTSSSKTQTEETQQGSGSTA